MKDVLHWGRCLLLLWLYTFMGFSGLNGVFPSGLKAQPLAGASANMPQADTTLPTRLASITTDTGDFAPGHQDFARYTTPDLCHAAVVWKKIVLRRSLAARADSLRYLAIHDTIGAAGVAAVARTCSARIPAAAVAADLPTMIQLALDQQDLPQARTLLSRFFAQHPAVFNRRLQIALIDYSLTQVHPANVAAATALMAQLDSLDASAVGVQLTAHLHLLDFWQWSADSARIRREATQILRRAHAVPSATLEGPGTLGAGAVDSAVLALIRLDWWAAPDSLSAELQRFCLAGLVSTTMHSICGHRTLAELRPELIASGILPGNGRLASGIPAGLIKADFWFPTPGGDTIVPAPGRISLLVFPNPIPRRMSHPTGNGGNAEAGVLREAVQRWVAHYGARGFQVTALAVTHGHAALQGLQHSAEEAQTIRWYVQDYLQMPVTVAVITTPVHQLPSPDMRNEWEDDSTAYGPMARYVSTWGPRPFLFALIDQTGNLVVETDDPGIIEEGIQALLSVPPAGSSPASSPQSSHRP